MVEGKYVVMKVSKTRLHERRYRGGSERTVGRIKEIDGRNNISY